MTATCIGRHTDDPPQPEPGLLLCLRCLGRLRRDLADIGRLRAMLDPTPARHGSTGRMTGKPGSRPPANITALAMTDTRSHFRSTDEGKPDPDNVANVDADLFTEARWVIEERHLNPPMRDAFDSLRIITIHVEWIASQPRVDEFAAVIAGCANGLRGVLRDWPERAVGQCTAAHDTREACGGPLRLDYLGPLPDDPDAQVAPTHIVCGWCGDTWPIEVHTLMAMLRVVKPKAFPVSRAWACQVTGVLPGTLDVWCHRGHVRSYADRQVNLLDVLARLDTPTPGVVDDAR